MFPFFRTLSRLRERGKREREKSDTALIVLLGELDADAQAAIIQAAELIDTLRGVIEEETALVHSGKVRDATALAAKKSELTSQLYASLANQITSAIFGKNASQSGTFSFEGTTITYYNDGTNIHLSINDGQTVTNVTVPAGSM